jgi:Domain of unknown function (DUF3327)
MNAVPLAIDELRGSSPLENGAVDRFLTRHEVPIVEGARCTFLYRGAADEVFLNHRIFGRADHLPLRRLDGTDLWYLVMELPEGSRVEYQLEVARGGQCQQVNDPLNPRLARSPLGSSSILSPTDTRYRTGRGPTPGPRRDRWRTWWWPARRCAGTAG